MDIQENPENWKREAVGYLRANTLVPDPVEMAIMSCLSDVQELIDRSDLHRANFFVNVAKVLLHEGRALLATDVLGASSRG